MEEVCIRFPHIIELINNCLDDQSLVKFKETSRLIFKITTEQKNKNYFWIRMIQSDIIDFGKFYEDWNSVFENLSPQNVKKLAHIVQTFYKTGPMKRRDNWGQFTIYCKNAFTSPWPQNMKKLAKIALNYFKKSSARRDRNWSPMHIVSENGNLGLCKKIAKLVENKKSKMQQGTVHKIRFG